MSTRRPDESTRRFIAVSAGLLVTVVVLVTAAVVAGMREPAESRTATAGDGAGTAGGNTAEPAATPTVDAGPAPLLPNLRSEPAEDISIQVVDGVRRLRFASIIANTGVGPLETDPDALRPCPPGQRHASQLLYQDADDDGRYVRGADTATVRRPAGCMLFHPAHDHWHFDKAARYALTRPGETTPVAAREKVSFCWRDRRLAQSGPQPRPEDHYGDCERDLVQGISPGWADVYSTRLRDQHLELPTDLPDGVYCLVNKADPLQLLVEATEDDNAAVVPIRLAGTSVTPGPRNACG